MRQFVDEVSIVLAGEAGQGVKAVENILVAAAKAAGFHVYATKEYMSRVRGGLNSTTIRVSSERSTAYRERVDILIPLSPGMTKHLGARLNDRTVILGEKNEAYPGLVEVPFTAIAKSCGSALYANSAAAGCLAGLLGIAPEPLAGRVGSYFGNKPEAVIEANRCAALEGHRRGRSLSGSIRISIAADPAVAGSVLWSGSDAAAFGALAGGCDFVCAYPMTPSTGVLTALARASKTIPIVVEQIEDEVGALNMALGAWYAGARALVTTSGGGFALMTEAVSLAGIIESPAVVLVSQRPGPATGLPTRTEQADLDLVLHAGHGEFPRVILAPGNITEAFELSRLAFGIADEFQVPVFILTDQYLVDTYYDLPRPEFPAPAPRRIVRTAADYRRYAFTADGLSPRGIPGHGDGFVKIDSDEHDEEGLITEDLALRRRMVDKRLKKGEALKDRAIPPEISGPPGASTLVVGWGSTKEMIAEAVVRLGRSDTAAFHFSQVWPLPGAAAQRLAKARRIVVVEGNAAGQLARLLRLEAGVRVDQAILKYDGLPFSVEEIEARLGEILGEGGQ